MELRKLFLFALRQCNGDRGKSLSIPCRRRSPHSYSRLIAFVLFTAMFLNLIDAGFFLSLQWRKARAAETSRERPFEKRGFGAAENNKRRAADRVTASVLSRFLSSSGLQVATAVDAVVPTGEPAASVLLPVSQEWPIKSPPIRALDRYDGQDKHAWGRWKHPEATTATSRRLAPVPPTGRTEALILARLSEQIPQLYYEPMPWELYTEDVVYANAFIEVRGKDDFKIFMKTIRQLVRLTSSNAELTITEIRFTDPSTVRMDWVTTVCSPPMDLCVKLEGYDLEFYDSDLYCYRHEEHWNTPLPAFLFPWKTIVFEANDIDGLVPPPPS